MPADAHVYTCVCWRQVKRSTHLALSLRGHGGCEEGEEEVYEIFALRNKLTKDTEKKDIVFKADGLKKIEVTAEVAESWVTQALAEVQSKVFAS